MIYNKYLDNDIDEKIGSVFSTVKKIVSFKNIIFILFALLLSTKTFIGDFRPFNYVMLAVASAFESTFNSCISCFDYWTSYWW